MPEWPSTKPPAGLLADQLLGSPGGDRSPALGPNRQPAAGPSPGGPGTRFTGYGAEFARQPHIEPEIIEPAKSPGGRPTGFGGLTFDQIRRAAEDLPFKTPNRFGLAFGALGRLAARRVLGPLGLILDLIDLMQLLKELVPLAWVKPSTVPMQCGTATGSAVGDFYYDCALIGTDGTSQKTVWAAREKPRQVSFIGYWGNPRDFPTDPTFETRTFYGRTQVVPLNAPNFGWPIKVSSRWFGPEPDDWALPPLGSPWPHTDPLHDPRSAPGAPPLGLPEKTPIPIDLAGSRVPRTDRSPHEQTQWGPNPAGRYYNRYGRANLSKWGPLGPAQGRPPRPLDKRDRLWPRTPKKLQKPWETVADQDRDLANESTDPANVPEWGPGTPPEGSTVSPPAPDLGKPVEPIRIEVPNPSNPPVKPPPPYRAEIKPVPPRPGSRDVKPKKGALRKVLQAVYTGYTEADDVIDCLYDALPKTPGLRRKYIPGRPVTIFDKMNSILSHADKIDYEKAAKCIFLNNVLEDKLIGGLSGRAESFMPRAGAGGLSPGWLPGMGADKYGGGWQPKFEAPVPQKVKDLWQADWFNAF